MLSGSLLVPYLLWLVRTEDRGHLSEEIPWAFLQGKPLAAFRPVLLTQELLKPAISLSDSIIFSGSRSDLSPLLFLLVMLFTRKSS